jgi:hypothetical protein
MEGRGREADERRSGGLRLRPFRVFSDELDFALRKGDECAPAKPRVLIFVFSGAPEETKERTFRGGLFAS